MKKATLLVATALLGLASCGGESGIPEGQGMADLKAAQLVEHNKGSVGFDITGSFNTKITYGEEVMERINVRGISGKATFEQLPASITELSFGLLQKMNARLDIGCADLSVKYREAEEAHKTIIELINPAITIGLNRNTAAFGITKETMEGVYIDGEPIENPQDCCYKVSPWVFDSDFDLPSYDSSAFSTYAGVLFNFTKAGGFTRAKLDIDFKKAEQLYVGLNTALYISEHPGDLSDPEYQKEIGNLQELYKEDIGEILTKDFNFNFYVDYAADRGINQFGIAMNGAINVNYLEAPSDKDLVKLDLNLDLTFKETGVQAFVPFTGDNFVNVR